MKYYGYYRCSTQSQVEHGYGLDTQREKIEEWAISNNIVIENFFHDDGISGATNDETMDLNRPGMNDLFSALGNGDRIVVLNTSRLWRNDTSKVLIRHELKKSDVDIVSIEQPNYSIYSRDASDFLINSIMEILDEYDKLLITRKLSSGRKTKASQGKKSCGICALGYRYDGNKDVVIDYNNHLIVQYIFQMYITTHSFAEVQRQCETKGYKTSTGKDFSKQGIKNIIENDFYTGVLTHANQKYQGEHEPIISKDIFDKANSYNAI